jgi:hypothetical protein
MNRFGGAVVVAAMAICTAAGAQSMDNSGARPGNVIGTGESLPKSGAASNINSGDTGSVLAPSLPVPAVGEDATAVTYLRAAQAAIAAGKTGEAQEALERAQTRRLSRPVDMRRTEVPSDDPVAGDIGQARNALAAGDKAAALGRIADALGLLGEH